MECGHFKEARLLDTQGHKDHASAASETLCTTSPHPQNATTLCKGKGKRKGGKKRGGVVRETRLEWVSSHHLKSKGWLGWHEQVSHCEPPRKSSGMQPVFWNGTGQPQKQEHEHRKTQPGKHCPSRHSGLCCTGQEKTISVPRP